MKRLALLALAAAAAYADPPPNLDFERGDTYEGWFANGDGYRFSLDTEAPHGGKRSLRIDAVSPKLYAAAGTRWPVEAVRGKRVKVTAWMRTEDTVHAILWVRVDGPGGPLAIDNMADRPVAGTTPWTLREVHIDVAPDATGVVFGAVLAGKGRMWVDDFAVAAADVAPVTIRGQVVDPAGTPIDGAVVALVPGGAGLARAVARAPGGKFAFAAPDGRYALTATAPGHAPAFRKVERIDKDIDVTLSLGEGGITIRGRVDTGGAPWPADGWIAATRISEDDGDVFYAPAAPDGTFAVTLTAAQHDLAVVARGIRAASRPVDARSQDVVLPATIDGAAPDAFIAWLKANAIPLRTAEPGGRTDDMTPIAKIVGGAHVVGLGEATHGTREFFQIKHRMVQFLVERMGFTVFAIEANWPESLAVDDYITTGKGDPKQALAGMYFWTWNTEEVLELIEWMRRWNADPRHKRKLHFYGFDMQTTRVAVSRVKEALAQVAPEAVGEPALALLYDEGGRQAFEKVEGAEKDKAVAALGALLGRFDREKPGWEKKLGAQGFARARQSLAIIRQAAEMRAGGAGGMAVRDRAMADNIKWLLDQEPRGTKMVVWAHNYHVSRGEQGPPMGANLAKAFGDDYVAFGFAFDQGSFQSMGYRSGAPPGLGEHTLGPSPPGSIGEAFSRAGLPLFALDLRRVAAAAAARWLAGARPMRQTGAVYFDEERMTAMVVLPRIFDAVFFVAKTTRARPVTEPPAGP